MLNNNGINLYLINIFKKNVLWFGWSILIIYLLLIKEKSLPSFKFHFLIPADKLVHFFLFFVLILLLCVCFYYQKKTLFLNFKGVVIFCFAGAIFGGFTEILQHFCTVDRYADVMDFLADVMGLLTGSFIFEKYFKIYISRKSNFLFLK